MKSKIIIITALISLICSCEKEISPEQAERFIKFYGNHMMDEARDVAILDDGSIAICGIDSLAGEGKRMVLILTDEAGNMRSGYPKYYTEEGYDSGANSLVVKRGGQGGFLICGYLERPRSSDQGIQKDLFLVRISSNGQELWMKSFGSQEDEAILHATEGISSGFMLAGYQESGGKRDIMIMGVTEEGDSIPLNLNYNTFFADNSSANYILNTGDNYLCVCTYDAKIGDKGTDILILNMDDDLSPNSWILDGKQDESARCIVEAGEDQYLVLGNRENDLTGQSEVMIHLIETNSLYIRSSLLLTTISERDADLYAERFVKTKDGRYAIVGTCEKDGNRDIFLQFLLSDYQVAERIIYGSAGDQSGADIDLPPDGGILMLGTNGYDENSMISLIKTDDSGGL